MPALDRDVYLRNYVMGVLVSYSDKGLNYSNMGELADDLTKAVIEGHEKWLSENQEEINMAYLEEDVPQ